MYDYKCDTCHQVYERSMPQGTLNIIKRIAKLLARRDSGRQSNTHVQWLQQLTVVEQEFALIRYAETDDIPRRHEAELALERLLRSGG